MSPKVVQRHSGQVGKGVYCRLLAYTLGNIFAKNNYQNRLMYVIVIMCQVSVIFGTQCILYIDSVRGDIAETTILEKRLMPIYIARSDTTKLSCSVDHLGGVNWAKV